MTSKPADVSLGDFSNVLEQGLAMALGSSPSGNLLAIPAFRNIVRCCCLKAVALGVGGDEEVGEGETRTRTN